MNINLKRILQTVQKPARYTGGEFGAVMKNKSAVECRVCFCFPDTYEIGMSNLGLHIMYGVLNEIPGVWCERAFAPWGDMADAMRAQNLPLYALESGDPVCEFDIVAFSLGCELSYTTVLDMLDQSGISHRASDRAGDAPLIIAGGMCAFNPEPLADFIDMFVIGEGEEVIGEIIAAYKTAKRGGFDKCKFLDSVCGIGGIYVPSRYDVHYNDDGTVSGIAALRGAPLPVKKRFVKDFDAAYYPADTIVPSTSVVHDRVVLELFRGCLRGCRFCQAGHVTRPVRERSGETLVRQAFDSIRASGYDEIALSSLSTSDYTGLFGLCDELIEWCQPRKVSLSLPSLRADNFSVELLERVQKVRKSGLTFAPEAGSQRLRDVINKNVTEEDLISTCRVAFEGGWSAVKLYFMLGLPTETDEDVLAIAALAHAVLRTWKAHAANKSRGVRITVSTSCFVPKAHTPFQWEAMVPPDEYARRVELLKGALGTKAITYNWHSPHEAFIEAAMARGDRRLGAVIEAAWRAGARLCTWGEYFSHDRWINAFHKCGIDPGFYASRVRETLEVLPWSVVSSGVSGDYLRDGRKAAYEGVLTPDCREQCADCGMIGFSEGVCRRG